tara:strand:+ start:281 stop:571 length:291 start_codon:yes stop_codon:yes gene_type:complete
MGIFDWLFGKNRENRETQSNKENLKKIIDNLGKQKEESHVLDKEIPKNGYGTYFFNLTGITYEGEWKDGLKHGKGKEIDSSGNIVEGIWENGKLIE